MRHPGICWHLGVLLIAALASGCGSGVGSPGVPGSGGSGPASGSGGSIGAGGNIGGGSGGAIYNDGNTFTLTLFGAQITNNTANEGGGAIFFVSNDLTGTLVIRDSTLRMNPSAGFETAGFPGIFVLANGAPQVTNSTIAK